MKQSTINRSNIKRNIQKRSCLRQKLALFLVMVLLATPIAELKVQAEEAGQSPADVVPVTTEETAEIMEEEAYSYETDFTITSSWKGHYNATITLKNTGDTAIHNWHLGFETKDTIESLWNGTVYKEEDGYHVIKNAGWNGDIAPGESVTFGFLAGCEEEPDTPENYTLPVGEIRVDEGDYTAEFTMENTWDSSFSGAGITIKNLTGEPMEDWSCTFDFAGVILGDGAEDFPVEITLLWDGEIVSHEGNRYTIKHAVNNADIPAGEEVTFGFNGKWETAVSGNDITMPRPTNITLSCTGYNPEAGENSGGQGEAGGNIEAGGTGNQGSTGEGTGTGTGTPGGTVSGGDETGGTVSGGDVSGNDPLEEMDSDGDGISDAAELRLGFDPYSADTDGDGMPDGYELYTLYPVLLDKGYPEEAGMLPEDDYDEDGLTNLEEYLANTHPGNADTDGDGLDDYEEIHTYETKPDSTDTDGDGLNDGLEISQGMNPDHTDSDGDGTPDGEETITQLLTVDETTKKPLSEAGVLPTLAITGKGDYSTRLTILDMSYHTMFERTGFVVGSAYDFYHPEEISFEGAELTFQISEEVLKENNLVDLAVAWYDEENKIFQVLDTTYDIKTSTITAKPEHFSTYTVLNKKRLYTNLIRGQKEAEEGNASLEAGQAGTGYYAPEAEDFNGHRYLLLNKSMSWTNAQAYCNELGGHLVIINNAEEQAFLTDLMARKGTQNTYYIGLSGENNQYSWVDGTPLSYTNWAPGEPNNSSENVIHMYVRDYGIAHAGEWNDTYNNTAFGGGFFYDAVYSGFICEFDGQRGPRYIVLSDGECVLLDADPALGDMSVDTDGDGIPDLVELGKEITMEIPKYYGAYYENDETVTVTAWEFRSNPAAADTDGDGFPDNNDLNPTEYDIAVEKVVGVTGGAGTVIRLNTGAIWRLSGLKNLNEYYEQYYTRIFNISPGGKEYLESIKELLDANKESNFTIKELATFQRIDLPGVVDYMDGRNFAFKKQLLSEVRGEQCTDEAARSAYSIVSAASAWTDYFRVTWNQIVRGKYAEETNLLGTIGEVGLAFVGFDFFQDFRDFTHGAIFWDEGNLRDKVETVINGTVSLVPIVGVLAKGDELLALIKHGDDVMELRNIEKLREIKNLDGVCYIDEFGLMSGSAGSALLGIDPSTYRMVLGVSDEYGFYRYSYDNPIVDAFADCEEIVKDLNKTSPGTLEEIAEEAAKQTGKSADEVEEFVEEALEDARKKVDAGGIDFGYTVLKTSSAEDVNTILKDTMGYEPPYKPGTIVTEIQLTEEVTFVRVYDKVNSRMEGGWVMRAEDIEGLTAKEIQNKFALPNTPKFVCDVNLEAGTLLRKGEVNPLFGFDGGGQQYDLIINGKKVGTFTNERGL